MRSALFPSGIELPPLTSSPWGRDLSAAQSEVERHFLEELPRHGALLATALLDAASNLADLDGESPFSSTLIFRGLIEVAGDAHWLFGPGLASRTRAERAITVYLIQTQTTLGQMIDARARTPDDSLDTAIEQGQEMLSGLADELREAGFVVGRSRRTGHYSVGNGKPSTTSLVDAMFTAHVGQTRVPPTDCIHP